MASLEKTSLSILSLAGYPEGKTIADAFDAVRELAQNAEQWGYHRFWLAEHHGMEGIASAATSVLIGHIASQTKTIRVGSGGIMLPNHSPYVVAEQFGTLSLLYPGRIDLGLGRAPGTDPQTAHTIRGSAGMRGADFPVLIEELLHFFALPEEGQRIRAIPGEGTEVPIYILGSSLFSAKLAASLGRPYAFAGHFAPKLMKPALEIYRSEFRPSSFLEKPYVMAGAPVVAAETDDKAKFLATSIYQTFLSLIRGKLRQTPPPVENMHELWHPEEEAMVDSMMQTMVVGGPERVKQGLQAMVDELNADELIITSQLYDYRDQLRSYEIIAEIAGKKRI